KYLVVGALGLVGRAMVERLDGEPGVQVIAVSRRAPDFPTGARFISVDLTDRAACARTFAQAEFADVTHVVYAALYEKPDLVAGWRDPEQIRTNTEMLRNVLDFVQPLAHLSLLQGTKAYGAHVGPMKLPGKERDPRHPHDNFYWNQEDLVRERAAAGGWTFTIFRPQVVCGAALGSPMNIVAAIGVYAAVSRALDEPLTFPGSIGFVTEMTDAELLAEAIFWAGGEAGCGGETLNVTNGDVLEWGAVWPELADVFGMPVGEPEPRSLDEHMPDREPVWQDIVAEHGLRPHAMGDVIGSSWQFADAVFGYGGGATTLLSTIRIRELGFHACIDTARMFERHLRRLQAERVLPR
ncbi:MAG: SDR family oxidoreductase, partial [Pseudomonadota bacterium]